MMTKIEQGLKLDCGSTKILLQKPGLVNKNAFIGTNQKIAIKITTLPAHVYANYRREAKVRANKACATNTTNIPNGKLYSKQ